LVEYRFDGNPEYGMWRRQTFLKFYHLLAGGLEKWAGIEQFGRSLQLMPFDGGIPGRCFTKQTGDMVYTMAENSWLSRCPWALLN
jgi:hypothetical protein